MQQHVSGEVIVRQFIMTKVAITPNLMATLLKQQQLQDQQKPYMPRKWNQQVQQQPQPLPPRQQ